MTLLADFQAISTRAEIPGFLYRHRLNRVICEVGVRFGYHLRQLLACDPGVAIGVDLWTDDGQPAHNDTGMSQRQLDATYQRVFHEFLPDPRVKLFRGYSVGAAECVDDYSLDFCYLDAAHDEESCWNDLNAWWKKIRRGGLFAGHDYVDEDARVGVPFGVIAAVQKFIAAKEIAPEFFNVTQRGYKSWMILNVEGE